MKYAIATLIQIGGHTFLCITTADSAGSSATYDIVKSLCEEFKKVGKETGFGLTTLDFASQITLEKAIRIKVKEIANQNEATSMFDALRIDIAAQLNEKFGK